MSVPAFAWALEQGAVLKLSPAERLVLIYLADRANGIKVCWPGQETIKAFTGLALRTVRSVLHSLAVRGLIRLEDSPGRVTRYHILRPETPANDDGVEKPNGKVIHSPRQNVSGSAPGPRQNVPDHPGTSRRAPRHITTETPANGCPEPYLTKKEPEERGACAPEAKAQNLDSGVEEASQQASPSPAYDPTFTTEEPKADPEAAQQAYAAALRAVRLRNPKRLATKYPANSVDQQLAATQGPPPPPAELKLDPRLAAGVLAARAALAESAAKRWQVAA